jgi:para-nitrobenzyl esterase
MIDLVRQTTAGALRGHLLGHVAEWAGIPYADPPVGALRFRPPVPPQPWTGVREAVSYAPRPLQTDAGPAIRTFLASLGIPQAQPVPEPAPSEDCLSVNVWRPADDRVLPVFVWIYGGGFEGGSATPPTTPGPDLARQLDAVVVTMGYRVGVLGYGWFGDLDPNWADAANLGLQDQIAALRWVRDNVASFGGDPRTVTVGGASAGAFSIGSLLSRADVRPLIQRAILHSGSTWRTFPRPSATVLARAFLAQVGAATPDDLLDVPGERLLEAQASCVTGDFGNRNLRAEAWGLVLDGVVIPEYPMAVAERGDLAAVPLLIATNADEMALSALSPEFAPASERALIDEMALVHNDPEAALERYRAAVGPDATLGQLRGAFLGDAIYVHRCDELADHQAAAGGAVWRMVLAAGPLGADFRCFHGAEGLLLSGTAAPGVDISSARAQLLAAWRGMVHHGDPGWAPYQAGAAPQVVA